MKRLASALLPRHAVRFAGMARAPPRLALQAKIPPLQPAPNALPPCPPLAPPGLAARFVGVRSLSTLPESSLGMVESAVQGLREARSDWSPDVSGTIEQTEAQLGAIRKELAAAEDDVAREKVFSAGSVVLLRLCVEGVETMLKENLNAEADMLADTSSALLRVCTDESLPTMERALVATSVWGSANRLVVYFGTHQRMDDALGTARRLLSFYQGTFGEGHPSVSAVLHNKANLEANRGDLESARQDFERALELRKASKDQVGIAASACGYADVLRRQGSLDLALEAGLMSLSFLEEAQAASTHTAGPTLMALADTYRDMESRSQEVQYLEKYIEVMGRVIGADHPAIERCRERASSPRD